MPRRVASFVLLAALGCIGRGAALPTVVAVGVAIRFDRDVDPLPFDPRGARLQAATAKLAEVAGHAVEFRFDTALLPEYQASFEDALIRTIETTASELTDLKDKARPLFDHAAPRLLRVECHYDAAARENSAAFDADARTLRVTLHPRAYSLLPDGLVSQALSDEYDDALDRRYGLMPPRAVPASEQLAYFHFRTGYRGRHGPHVADLSVLDGYATDPAASEIIELIELDTLAQDKGLRAEIRQWLAQRGDYFTGAYMHHPDLVADAPASGTFHRAEVAWVHWLASSLPTMSDAERVKIAKTVFVKLFNRDVGRYGRFAPFAFPGFDPLAFGLAIVDEWRQAGYPIDLPQTSGRGELYEFIVCPHPLDARGVRSRAPRCDYDLYEFALSTTERRQRFFRALLDRRDAVFTETAFVNVGMKGNVEDVIDTWRALEGDDATWRVATRVVAEELAETSGDRLLDETRRLWRTFPGRRGALLYVLSQVDRYGNGRVPWSDLPTSFGATIGPLDFAAFLDSGPRAMSTASVVWPALGKGWSRAAIVADRLERYLDDPLVREYNFQDPWLALRNIVNCLCAERRADDLPILHARFEERAIRKPSEARAWANLIEDTRPGACR